MPTDEFDLKRLGAPKYRFSRVGTYIAVGGGVLFALLSIGYAVQIFLVPPHYELICAKGGCSQVTPSSYHPQLEVFSVTFGALAAFLLVSTGWS